MSLARTMLITGFFGFVLIACSADSADSTADAMETATTTASTITTPAPVETTESAEPAAAQTTTTASAPETTAAPIDDSTGPVCGTSVRLVFDEGAPRDRMTIMNDSTEDVSIAAVDFDLANSAGQVIFDTLEGGSGVEVFQDFQVEGGDASLTETPVAQDGASSLRLEFTSFAPTQTFIFSIDVDDQLTDSDLGQIQVTGGELAGAEAIITTADGARVFAVFGENDAADLVSAC